MTEDPAPTVASSTLGAIGRFGNQVLQYGFLRLYAERHGLALETPAWIGTELFGCRDAPVASGRRVVTELALGLWSADFEARTPATGADLWGWFLVDTARLAGQRDLFRQVFQTEPRLAPALEAAALRLRAGGRTPVGIHLRRKDYRPPCGHPLIDSLYPAAPLAQYREWLDQLWPTLENPVLFVATDGSRDLLDELAPFSPETALSLGARLPEAPYYPDFFLLQRCAALAISNSTFSFAAAMLAPPATLCMRPDPASGRLAAFDPWASTPHLAMAPGQALERADPGRFRAEVAAAHASPVAVRATVEPSVQPVTALLGDRSRRGFLELEAALESDPAASRFRLRWQDAEEPAASFRFESREPQLFHGDQPQHFAGFGQAHGSRLDGPAWSLLVVAEVPGRPGELFLALTLLAAGPHSFFIQARGQGTIRGLSRAAC